METSGFIRASRLEGVREWGDTVPIPTLARFAHSRMLRKVNITRTIDILVELAIFGVT